MRAPLRVAAIGLVWVAGVAAQEVRLPVGDARVTGRVVAADNGAPLVGAEVTLQGVNLPPALAYKTTTDASGAFDFQNVYAPRDYRLTAAKAGFFAKRENRPAVQGEPVSLREGQTATGVSVALVRGGAITGRIVDIHGDPVDGIRVYAQRLQYGPDGSRVTLSHGVSDVTNDLGHFRLYALQQGDYHVVAAGRGSRAAAVSLDMFIATTPTDTVPTYYPGTPDEREAQVVSLAGGAEAHVQIVLREQRAVSVSGVVRRSDGASAADMRLGISSTAGGGISSRSTTVARDGSFVFMGVAPGTYVVESLWLPVAINPETRAAAVAPLREYGSASVTVGDQDIRDVSIVTTRGATLTGTVVFERPFAGQSFQLTASPAQNSPGLGAQSVSEHIGPDGRFTLAAVYDHSGLSVVNSSWMVKSVVVDGREIGEGPLELNGRTRITDVRVTVTDRLPELSGRVVDDRKRPLGDHAVVLLRLDSTSLRPQDRVVARYTSDDGSFTTPRLRPGSYVAGAFADLAPGIHYSPDFQELLRQHGERFSLDEGEVLRLDLQPTRGLP
jgi:hypothetical protein